MMKKYTVIWCLNDKDLKPAPKIKDVVASNPLSACKKAFKVSGWHWVYDHGNQVAIMLMGKVQVQLENKIVAECSLEDNG